MQCTNIPSTFIKLDYFLFEIIQRNVLNYLILEDSFPQLLLPHFQRNRKRSFIMLYQIASRFDLIRQLSIILSFKLILQYVLSNIQKENILYWNAILIIDNSFKNTPLQSVKNLVERTNLINWLNWLNLSFNLITWPSTQQTIQ